MEKNNKNQPSKYIIEINEEQAKIISFALYILSRIEAGQLNEVFSMIPWKYYENLDSAESMIKELQLMLTGMETGNISISELSNLARISYDLHQVIRHQLAWDIEPKGGIGVSFNPPIKWSDQPLAKIKRLINK